MSSIEEKKEKYFNRIMEEMVRRGIKKTEISKIIAKTGFMTAFEKYPEEQLHYSIEDAVDEILLVAAQK